MGYSDREPENDNVNHVPFTLIKGGHVQPETDERLFSSDIYFSNQIFGAVIGELEHIVQSFAHSTITEHGNLFRRGQRLLRIGKELEKVNLCVNTHELHSGPSTEAYAYLEELVLYFSDAYHPEIAAFLDALITSELVSEIVTSLIVRPGRQASAAVLAVHYHLVAGEDADAVLASAGLNHDSINNFLYSAHLDIDEIAHELQYRGNYKAILAKAQEKLAA